jgi:LacI family repressor for deo operon, udp, cdd, tsx, nupC, and nupG
MPGIEAVAKRAGVSVSTVSRALREVPGVSASTRQRVRSAAAEMGFVLSVSGSRLATGRTGSVAIVVPTAGTWFFGQVITAAGSVVRGAAMDLLLFELGDPEGRRRFFVDQRLRGRADGLLVLSLNLTPDETEMLRRLEIPVVMLGSAIDGFGCVRIDNFVAGVGAVRHLINLGHEHIGYIGIDDHASLTGGSQVLAKRLAGYDAALMEAGLPHNEALRQFGENTTEGGRRAMAQLLSAPVLPTAVFVGSDQMAFGVLDLLRSAGLSVPGDLSIVGFDNHEFSDLMHLSTVDQSIRTQGEAAAQALLAAIEDPGAEPADVMLHTHLVLRGSTAPPRPHRIRGPADTHSDEPV